MGNRHTRRHRHRRGHRDRLADEMDLVEQDGDGDGPLDFPLEVQMESYRILREMENRRQFRTLLYPNVKPPGIWCYPKAVREVLYQWLLDPTISHIEKQWYRYLRELFPTHSTTSRVYVQRAGGLLLIKHADEQYSDYIHFVGSTSKCSRHIYWSRTLRQYAYAYRQWNYTYMWELGTPIQRDVYLPNQTYIRFNRTPPWTTYGYPYATILRFLAQLLKVHRRSILKRLLGKHLPNDLIWNVESAAYYSK